MPVTIYCLLIGSFRLRFYVRWDFRLSIFCFVRPRQIIVNKQVVLADTAKTSDIYIVDHMWSNYELYLVLIILI